MNISSKYDLGDIVKELGSTHSAKASKTAGSEASLAPFFRISPRQALPAKWQPKWQKR